MNWKQRLFDARLASLFVIVLGAAASLALAIEASAWYGAETAALSDLEFRTSQLEARAASLSTRRQLTEARPSTQEGQVLIQGDTPGLIAAELQRIVTYNAEMAGATVRSVDSQQSSGAVVYTEQNDDGLVPVRMTVEVELTERLLPDFLYSLETDQTVLIVDGFSLRGPRKLGNIVQEADGQSNDELSLRMDVSSFRIEKLP